MAFKDMREFMSLLAKHGELREIKQEVDWDLEAGAILRRTYEKKLPAPFFQKVKEYPEGYRLFGGMLSTLKRCALALEMDPENSYKEIMNEYMKRKDNLIKPILVKDGPCKENIYIGDEVDLYNLPAPMVHDGDGGRYLVTWAAIVTKDPDSDWFNWGLYRGMIRGKDSLTGLVMPYQHIGMHYAKYEARNQPMPFAIAFGMEPICHVVAFTDIDYGVNEVDVAGALRREPVELVKCETVDLAVPATAEIVIEGEMLPKERAIEGPFGEFTGYTTGDRATINRPIWKVKAITHRNDPILSFSCVGIPVDEGHLFRSITRATAMLEKLRANGLPVVDVNLLPEAAYLMVIVSVKPAFANIAERVASTLWGSKLGGHILPYVIVVEDDIDPYNLGEVLHALASKCHPARGIHKLERAACCIPMMPFLDPHERMYGLGAKVYFDCLWPYDWDRYTGVPRRASFNNIYPKEVQEHVLKNWKSYGYKEG